MKGATAEPCANTKSAPSNNKTIMMGASQNFLRSFMNPHKSFNKSIISMASLRDLCCVGDWPHGNWLWIYQSFSIF